MVVLSGDFVQNGTRAEFAQAREFLKRLPPPLFCVPGNHDLPFANLWKRFRVGLGYYREYIAKDPEPFFADNEIAILGLNTARKLQVRGGSISESQIQQVERKLCSLDGDVFKILVTHHPFDLPMPYPRSELVGKARAAMGRIAQSVDLLLAGHMHISHAASTSLRYRLQGRSAVFVQAGTATSTRGRGEPNSFNVIRVDPPQLLVERHQWDAEGKTFRCLCVDRFPIDHEPPVCATGETVEPAPEQVETVEPENATSSPGTP
jgi:3',5'-cyclic AMP phosphodiesterase CpdA